MVIIFGEFSKFENFSTLSPTLPILENLLKLKFVQNPHFLHFGEVVGDVLIGYFKFIRTKTQKISKL